MQAPGLKGVPLARFRDQVFQFILDLRGQDQTRKPGGRIAGADQLAEFALRRCKQGGTARGHDFRRLAGVRPGAQLLSQTRMPLLLLGGSQLHREIEEARFIAFCVALHEAYELLG